MFGFCVCGIDSWHVHFYLVNALSQTSRRVAFTTVALGKRNQEETMLFIVNQYDHL